MKAVREVMTFAVFILFLAGTLLYPSLSGLLLIFSMIVFGSLTSMWKENRLKLISFSLLVLLSIINILVNGLNFGIDFSGGTKIPVILERSIDQHTMNEMVDIIKRRASVLGLTEVKVRAIGTTEIDVELPSSDETLIENVESVLSNQGVFLGVVDGRIALRGSDILQGSITSMPSASLEGADWGVRFYITSEGANNFADVVKGKARYPLYMFLDRPTNVAVLISEEHLVGESDVSAVEALMYAKDSLKLEGDDTEIFLLSESDEITNVSTIITCSCYNITEELTKKGFNVTEVSNDEITPSYVHLSGGGYIVEEWEAVGLLSAPLLSESVTEGLVGYTYSITGSVSGVGSEKEEQIANEVKKMESILKGGALPVGISLGSKTVISPLLGEEFLRLSVIGIVLAVVAISVLVGLRYRRLKVFLPIIAISVCELVILFSIVGSFTMDLAAMGGIIAAIGVSVDAQIVITDEILKKDVDVHTRLENAFSIITTNVTVAIIVMLPLLFSGLVEIIGFAISTMLGALLGLLISRPTYAAIVEHIE